MTLRSEKAHLESWRFRYLSEALISDIWQAWCLFVRGVVHLSCCGCITRSNNVVNKRFADNSWQRIGYEAQQAAQRRRPLPSRKLTFLRQEPTWGDINKLLEIIVILKPCNELQLLSSFGLPLRGPKHLQIVRNACAHKHKENIGNVGTLLIFYRTPPLAHPIELVWQFETASGEIALYKWIDDLETIASLATK